MNKKEKKQLLASIRELVYRRINKKEISKYLAEKSNGKVYAVIEMKDLLNKEDFRMIFTLEIGNDVITGDIWYLKTRVKNNIYITEISID